MRFDLNYPGAPAFPSSAEGNEKFPLPPHRPGCRFLGWTLDPRDMRLCRLFYEDIPQDALLYARWGEPKREYTAEYRAARQAVPQYMAYRKDSWRYLFDCMFEMEFHHSKEEMEKQAKDPDEDCLPLFEDMSYALGQLRREEADSWRCFDLWGDSLMPALPGFAQRKERAQGILEDDEGFRPFLIDLCLPEPDKAKGTAILSPSIRGGYGEAYLAARELNRRGYNAFAVEPRFARLGDGGSQFQFGYQFPLELLDVQRAIRVVRHRAEEWGIDAEKLITVGFSKGNCIHFVSSSLFDLPPCGVTFLRENGGQVRASGHETDAIDRESAHVAVNAVVYGGLALCPDGKTPAVRSSRIYSPENFAKGLRYPAVFYAVGNRDEITFPLLMELNENNRSPDRLYEIPWECHIFDKVPHGVGAGMQYSNFAKVWDNADAFFQMSFFRAERT